MSSQSSDTNVPSFSIQTINPKQLNDLVDSSIKIADRVLRDEQDIKGERWIIRFVQWEYQPFRFQISYHVLQETAQVLFFQYYRITDPKKKLLTCRDTDKYRRLIQEADQWRRVQP